MSLICYSTNFVKVQTPCIAIHLHLLGLESRPFLQHHCHLLFSVGYFYFYAFKSQETYFRIAYFGVVWGFCFFFFLCYWSIVYCIMFIMYTVYYEYNIVFISDVQQSTSVTDQTFFIVSSNFWTIQIFYRWENWGPKILSYLLIVLQPFYSN